MYTYTETFNTTDMEKSKRKISKRELVLIYKTLWKTYKLKGLCQLAVEELTQNILFHCDKLMYLNNKVVPLNFRV